MPAPVPIDIRYGSMMDLGGLAAASGAAAYDLEERRLRDSRMEQRRAQDLNILTRLVEIRAEDQWRQNSLSASRSGSRMLQDAAGYGGSSVQTIRPDMEQVARRAAAQAVGTITGRGAAGTRPLDLVPAEGPITPPPKEPSYIQSGGVRTENYRGSIIQSRDDASRDVMRAEADRLRALEPEMVTRDVRTQMDYLRSLQGQIPDDQWNALWVAARSGQVDLSQLIDDARQAIPDERTPRQTTLDRNMESRAAEAAELEMISSLSPQDQARYARQRFGMQDPDIFGDEDALEQLESRRRQLAAIARPVQNSSGATPTGGNVVSVTSPEEALRLPSGTYFRRPDGTVMRRP